MEYISFDTEEKLQQFILNYDERVAQARGFPWAPGCHYTQPTSLIPSAPFFVAVMKRPFPVPLTPGEEAALVPEESVAPYLPPFDQS